MKRQRRAAVPLRYRLPNPPAPFVGRREEAAALSAAIRGGRACVVWGIGGIGKTALVLHTLHARFARAVPRVLSIALRPESPAPELEVARVLGSVTGQKIDWPGIAGDREAIVGAAIDLAESGPWWIALEDLHHADPAAAASFLGLFARYARRSRLVATSRVDPAAPGIVSIPLGPMPGIELAALARRHAKMTADEAHAAARASAGSPWRLLRGLAGAPPGEGLGVPEAVEEFLVALATVEVPLPRATVEEIAAVPEPVDRLVRRGLLDATGGGLRVNDLARAMLPSVAPARARELQAAAGRALAGSRDPAASMEGVRLLLAAGLPAEAAAAASAGVDALLAAGFGPALRDLLGQEESEDAFLSVRLRCAVDVGTPEAVARLRLPPSPTLDDELAWARSRRIARDLDAAAAAAGALREKALRASEARIAFESGLLRGWCVVQGAPAEALSLASSLEAPSAADEARRDVLRAQSLAYLGRVDEALAITGELSRIAPRLPPAARLDVGCGIGRVLYDASRLAESEAALDDVLELLGPAAMLRFHGRVALHLKTFLSQDRGRIGEARSLLARLEPLRGAGFLQGSTRSIDANLRLAAGDLEGLDAFLLVSIAEASASGNPSYRAIAEAVRIRLASLEGRRALPDAGGPETPDPLIRATRRLARIQNDRRHRLPPSEPPPEPHELATSAELRVLARIVASEASLIAGDPAGAVADARTAAGWAREAGLGLLEAEAILASCDALLAERRDAALAETLRRAEALALEMPSPRLKAEAGFHRAILAGDPAALELAVRSRQAPAAARRARALLEGTTGGLDALDEAVLAAARARPDWADLATAGEGAAWGIDERRTSVWTAAGRTIPLRKKAMLFGVLSALAARGGRASKEELVQEVWREREYHPLRHDNRLHLAVLKVRREIEDDPKLPVRLLATPDGYALGGRVRRRR